MQLLVNETRSSKCFIWFVAVLVHVLYNPTLSQILDHYTNRVAESSICDLIL